MAGRPTRCLYLHFIIASRPLLHTTARAWHDVRQDANDDDDHVLFNSLGHSRGGAQLELGAMSPCTPLLYSSFPSHFFPCPAESVFNSPSRWLSIFIAYHFLFRGMCLCVCLTSRPVISEVQGDGISSRISFFFFLVFGANTVPIDPMMMSPQTPGRCERNRIPLASTLQSVQHA